jgi:uncharacterized membrane protein YciS (DUF1049 family)
MENVDYAASMREHAWRYFEVHSSQRITVFNYFLAVSGATTAGLAATLQGTQRFASLGIALGALLALVAFIFWKLDQRVSFLIKRAEASLAETEQTFPSKVGSLFLLEPTHTKAAADEAPWWNWHWTYGTSFRLIFALMALVGVVGSALSALRFLGCLSWQ